MSRAVLIPLAAALLVAGCALSGPDYQRPGIELPGGFDQSGAAEGRAAQAGAPDAQPVPRDWWLSYRDPQLDALVANVLARNSDLRLAIAQVDEADAVLREVWSVLYPQIYLDGGISRSQVSAAGAVPLASTVPRLRTDNRIALSTSYEIDFWGKVRRGAEAAEAQTLATRYARDVVELALTGAATQAWFALRSVDSQIALTRESLALRVDSLDLVRARARGGVASELELNQAESARAEAAVQLNELERQRAAVERQLGVLSGRPDLRVEPGDLQRMPVPPTPPPGLPSSLLDRRPDLRQAEENLVAANARIGVAKAALRPTITLNALLGGQSAELSDLLTSGARIWTLGFGLSLPIFDAGRLDARVDQAEARQRQALAAYQRTAETAYREVADALENLARAQRAEADLNARLLASRNSVRLSTLRYDSGYSGYLEVIDAQRVANEAGLAFVRNRQAMLAYSVDLMKALGGGWTDPAQPAAAADLNGERSSSSSR